MISLHLICTLYVRIIYFFFFFFQAEDGIRDVAVTGVQTCALPICRAGDKAFKDFLSVYNIFFPDEGDEIFNQVETLEDRKSVV